MRGDFTSEEDRPAGGHDGIDVLPSRPLGGTARLTNTGLVATEAKADRTTYNNPEFTELATSVRKWLALTRAKNVPATPVDRPDLSAPLEVVPDSSRWQDQSDREGAVGLERSALLIDAEHLTSARLPHLIETVRVAYGTPVISRAYADWTTPGLASWFAPLRQYGVQPIHNFDTHDHSRSLVALSLEAIDIVDRYAVTRVVLVGDLGAALPLVTRLKAAGVKVAVIGPACNPDDLRRDADEFLDIASLSDPGATPVRGRHQA